MFGLKQVSKIAMPSESRLAPGLAGSAFHDAFEARLDDLTLTAVEIAAASLRSTPRWVEALLTVRNAMAKPFGVTPVTPLGRLEPATSGAWRAGDRFGMFNVMCIDDDELVLGIDDAHLDVRISVLRRRARSTYVIASLVHTHNAVGTVYMWPVGLVHPLIVNVLMARLQI